MNDVPFPLFVERILTVYSTGRHARKTYLRIRQVLRELAAIGLKTTADLTTESLARWLKTRGPLANPNTLNGLLGAVSAACTVAVDEGWLLRRPNFGRLRFRETPGVRNKPRGYDEISRLLDHLHAKQDTWQDRRICALCWTVALTGVRLNEAAGAWCADLDLVGAQALTIDPRRRLKTRASARIVPVPDVLATVLRPWLAETGSPWLFPGAQRRGPWVHGSKGYRSIDHLKREALAVGIDRITWHSLRHAYGTYSLERWEVPLWIVQRVMGHQDIRTTQRYLHLDRSPAIAQAVKSIGYRTSQAS